MCVGDLFNFSIVRTLPLSLEKTAVSPSESPALAAQLRAFSVIPSSHRAELSTSRNHSVGKVSAFADGSYDRSHPLSVCQRYCGRRRLLASPSTSAMSAWGEARSSTLHRPCGQRSAARHSNLGRSGTDFITLKLHCVRTRPAEKEVRLRLVFIDARFILSGSVVHFVPSTSSEGERRRETVKDGVPLLSTPPIQTRRAESLRCHFAPVPGLDAPEASVPPLRLRDLRRLRRAHTGLVSVHGSNPSASISSLKPLPPARLARPKCVAVPP